MWTIRHARPPLIGIVTHELHGEPEPAWASAPGRRERDLAPARLSLRLTYVQAVSEAGGLGVVLPAHGFADDAHALLDRVDGLLFSGGPDLDPATYGQARHPRLGPEVDRVADDYELALLAAATERDVPLLAICRGMQALNVARRGTLHQHLAGHRQAQPPYDPTHLVTVAPGSPLHRITGRRRLAVNSFHHQAVERVGAGLRVVGRAPDGTVEAIEGTGYVVGVQWHAETLHAHLPLFEGLVRAAARTELRIAA